MAEYKNIPFEFKDIDSKTRTAVIAHCVYDNIDRTKDISRKGMFNKSWEESKSDINFYLNHDDTQAPGKVINVYEDEQKAYTEVKIGTHTLGEDCMKMMLEGVIRNASFGYYTVKSNEIKVKDQAVRELKEVKHVETSILTKMPANPLAGVVNVVKSFNGRLDLKTLTDAEQNFLSTVIKGGQTALEAAILLSATLDVDSDLYTYIQYFIIQTADQMGGLKSQLKYGRKELDEMKAHNDVLKKFVRNTKASDDCIKSVSLEVRNIENILSGYDTAGTHDGEPAASKDGDELKKAYAKYADVMAKGTAIYSPSN